MYLAGRKWKESVFPWPTIHLQTEGCYTLCEYWNHTMIMANEQDCHFLMCKGDLILVNHSDINKRKGSVRCPLLNTSHINGFNFKGNEIFYSENPGCIVVQCWIVPEMVHSWWAGTPANLHSISTSFPNLLEILLPLRNPDILQTVWRTLNDFWNENEVIFTAILNILAVKGAFMVSFITVWIDFFS